MAAVFRLNWRRLVQERAVSVRAGTESTKQGLKEDLGLRVFGVLRVPEGQTSCQGAPGSAVSARII